MKTMKSRRSGGDRGGIRKRGPIRTDRDGDMDMDAPGGRGGKRGGRGGPGRPTGSGSGSGAGVGRPARSGGDRPQARDKTLEAIQKAISNTRDSQVSIRQGKNAAPSNLELFSVLGWKESKVSSHRDGGVENLIAFLERRMNAHSKSGPRARITKSRVEGDSLVVFVRPDLSDRMLRLHDSLFAGVHLVVEPYDPSSSAVLDRELGTATGTSPSTADTKSKMTLILSKRYYPDTKLLDLSKLSADPDLVAMGIFNQTSTESKFFPALMKVWEMGFTNAAQRREAVESVSLAHNSLTNVTAVTTLSQTFPDIKNLDLSHNNLKDYRSINAWRWKFRNLEFLDLTENPFSAEPNFKETMMKWYPKLQTLNNVIVRTAEEIAAQKKTPIPVQAPHFQDDGQIAENFIRAFFTRYDNSRDELVKSVYDSQSEFTLNVNTSAPKAQQTESAGWDPYIKKSRNLLKINHLPARMSRAYTGADKILELWKSLPQTRHPDMSAHPEEYLVECHPVPGLPDPTGQSPTGVGGLMIMVHGKFEESVGGKVETRSFDRTFIIGPGGGMGGIRVINDILCLRAYGGHEAWSPENQAIPYATAPVAPVAGAAPVAVPAPAAAVPAPVAQPGIPQGYGAPAPGKTDAQVQQELLVAQMSAKSGMTLQFSEMALSGNGWNLDAAWKNFEELKASGSLPATAFLSPA
ncbi:uncharacterized protein N7473_001128 [Penicillium subrubescens]|uniref:mRNA export factor MEX67 n=1 Tax=Penicillium subrubescens TaxID=1316194 RepID=A0A1Q5UJ22_9EURO|nr:uncharacterized protein N7473_001128 [Penicillium subrubescens]KAJ5911825.1 hypothetical protein N7473_001128 [Penicillium subrubescens]OKP12470.1 mRNA export factor MEX67 [Penicillium subrubescens]